MVWKGHRHNLEGDRGMLRKERGMWCGSGEGYEVEGERDMMWKGRGT